jgi:hypothetical protein
MMRRLFLSVLCTLAIPGSATAGDDRVALGLGGGGLSVTARSTNSRGIVAAVRDARGTGRGWTLSVRGHGTVARIVVRCARGSTCTLPSSGLSLPVRIGSNPTAVLTAAEKTGMGAFIVVIATQRPNAAALQVTISAG